MPPRKNESRDDAIVQPESGYPDGHAPTKPSADSEMEETGDATRKGSEAEFDSPKPSSVIPSEATDLGAPRLDPLFYSKSRARRARSNPFRHSSGSFVAALLRMTLTPSSRRPVRAYNHQRGPVDHLGVAT
jgi:hypothetical protein